MIFATTVAGIPCQCKVTHYRGAVPMKVCGSGMGDADEAIEPEFNFEILDRNGRPAKWLEAKLKEGDADRLYEEFHLERQAELWDDRHRIF